MGNDLIMRLEEQIHANAALIAEILSKGNDAELRKDTGGTLKIKGHKNCYESAQAVLSRF